METSYAIICAADLRAPKNAYLELLDQPARTIPYTLKEDIAKKYKIPKSISAKTTPYLKGITNQFKRLKKKTAIGVNKKITVFALLGKIVSLKNNFKPSAMGCVNPKSRLYLVQSVVD
jgi:hypothetical protein